MGLILSGSCHLLCCPGSSLRYGMDVTMTVRTRKRRTCHKVSGRIATEKRAFWGVLTRPIKRGVDMVVEPGESATLRSWNRISPDECDKVLAGDWIIRR